MVRVSIHSFPRQGKYPWFSELVSKYWPELESLIPPDETVAYKFIGLFEGLGSRTHGLFVITDKKIYARGTPKARDLLFTSVTLMKLAGSKKFQVIPLESIYEIIDKRKYLIFKIKLDWVDERHIGKRSKFLIRPEPGKEKGLEKESREEWLNRVAEYRFFIMSQITG